MDVGTTTGYLAACCGGLAVALFAQAWFRWHTLRGKLSSLPRPSGSLPILGHALQLTKDRPWETFEKWVKEFDYSAIVVDFMMQSGIVVASPAMLRRILDKNQKNYKKDTDLAYKSFMDLLGHGILTSHGEKWRSKRHMLSSVFRAEILEETAPVAKRAADRLSAILEEHVRSGEPIDIAEEFRVMTLQVIGELLLSLSPEESKRVFPELYLPIVNEANLRVWFPWRKYMPTPTNLHYHRTLGKLNSYLADLIQARWNKRRAAGLGKDQHQPGASLDILDRILASVEPEDWSNAILVDLRDEMKSFMLAGHETSASMLTWSVYELMLPENKAVLDRLLQEGRSLFKTCRGTPSDGKDQFEVVNMPPIPELNNLAYTVNTLKESLRKYSLVPIVSRDAIDDDNVEGVFVPAGTKIFINIKAVHWNPQLWPEPAKFLPERFEKEYDSYAFLPFIQGPRICLGQHLALLEARIVLSLLEQRFVFSPAREDLHLTHEILVPVCPKHGMILTVKHRQD